MTTTWHFRCTECGAEDDDSQVRTLCPNCSAHGSASEPLRGVLEVVYDRWPRSRRARAIDVMEMLPLAREHFPVYACGDTPLVPSPALARAYGLETLWLKLDSQNPSGSLKDRASWLVVAQARACGIERVVAASTGNAASSLAAVAAAGDRRAIIFVPKSAPRAKLVQMVVHGAEVVLIDGTYDDAFRLSRAYTDAFGGLSRNTAYNPLTIEGKKTVSLEIFNQLGGRAPSTVLVPTGDGVILAGVHKGFVDLAQAGRIDSLPRLVAVQAEGSAAISDYVARGSFVPVQARTIADSISVSVPSNAHLARRAIGESGGRCVVVSDAEILACQQELARRAGVFVEPAAAATLAGLKSLVTQVDLGPNPVLLLTGHGLKDVGAVERTLTLPTPIPPQLEALPRALMQSA